MHEILFSIWFFLPAGIANAVPVFAPKIKFLRVIKKPIDFGHELNKKRILGDNKTWLGLTLAVTSGLIVILIQIIGYKHSAWIRSISGNINYSETKIIILGPLLGFGALFGDSVESFIKRQMGIKPGRSWFPFDQLDYIFGGLLFSSLIVQLSLINYLIIVIVWVIIHLLGSYVGYLLGLKAKPI